MESFQNAYTFWSRNDDMSDETLPMNLLPAVFKNRLKISQSLENDLINTDDYKALQMTTLTDFNMIYRKVLLTQKHENDAYYRMIVACENTKSDKLLGSFLSLPVEFQLTHILLDICKRTPKLITISIFSKRIFNLIALLCDDKEIRLDFVKILIRLPSTFMTTTNFVTNCVLNLICVLKDEIFTSGDLLETIVSSEPSPTRSTLLKAICKLDPVNLPIYFYNRLKNDSEVFNVICELESDLEVMRLLKNTLLNRDLIQNVRTVNTWIPKKIPTLITDFISTCCNPEKLGDLNVDPFETFNLVLTTACIATLNNITFEKFLLKKLILGKSFNSNKVVARLIDEDLMTDEDSKDGADCEIKSNPVLTEGKFQCDNVCLNLLTGVVCELVPSATNDDFTGWTNYVDMIKCHITEALRSKAMGKDTDNFVEFILFLSIHLQEYHQIFEIFITIFLVRAIYF